MTNALTSLFSEHSKVETTLLTADHSATTDVGWVDAQNFRKFTVMSTAVLLTGAGLTTFELEGNSANDGSGTNVLLVAHPIGTAPDAVGDSLFLEVDIDDAAAGTDNIRFVNARVIADNALDDHHFTYILSAAKNASAGQSADIIA